MEEAIKKSSGIKSMLLYGALLAIILLVMQWLKHKFVAYELNTETYLAIVGSILLGLGIWLGNRLNTRKQTQKTEGKVSENSQPRIEFHYANLSKREFDVLKLIASGYSNQAIVDELFISLSTVKTHSSNLFQKLDVSNRVMAVNKAKEIGLLV
ncbi:MAG: response regulator transcription factor [Bacteroidetes bacterium]|nr:response regulator transcription factor [Bacteroidota bacterium]